MKKVFLYGFLILLLIASFAINIYAVSNENTISSNHNYVLIFNVVDYNSKLKDVLEYYFKKVLKPQDQLSILTPVKAYSFSAKTRQSQTKEKLIELTTNVLKRDITDGTANYHQVIDAMTRIIYEIGNGVQTTVQGSGMTAIVSVNDLKNHLVNYRQLIEEMHRMRIINEKLFVDLARFFKKQKGENQIFVFYQKEFRSIPNREVMQTLRENPDIRFDAMNAFLYDTVEEFIDVEKVNKLLKESAVTLSFFYVSIKEKNRRRSRTIQWKEFSGDVYNIFSKIAKATGGTVVSTSKPEAALKKTIEKMGK